MTIPFVCDGASIVLLEPALHGGWWWWGVALAFFALCCAIAASLWTPVAGPFARSEERAGSRASLTFIGLTGIGVLCVLFGLGAMQMPLGCSTHAILVSAAIPASSEPDARHRAEEARSSVPANRAVRDLSGVRDAVLGELMTHADEELSRDTVADAVRKAITHTMRYGFPEPAPAVRAEALNKFDSSVIEGIEIALLMGWRALYSSDEQGLTYVVSDRSERYEPGWWDTLSNRYFRQDHTNKNVLDVSLVGGSRLGAPVLMQPIRTVKVDTHSLVVEALFATNGAAGSATIDLTGPSGEIGNTAVSIPASAGTTTLAEIRFSDVPNVDKGDTLRQQTDEGTIVRSLPTPQQDRSTLDLRQYEELRDTLKFLAGDTTSCPGASADLMAQIGEWRSTFSRPQDAAPNLESDEHEVHKVALARAPFGGVIVLPPDSGFETNIDLARLHIEPTVRQLTASGRVIAWGTSAAPRRYDLERLGIDGIMGTLVPADRTVPVAVALAQDMKGIAGHRLDREDVSTAVGAGLILIALKDIDPEKPSLRHRAAVLLGDPVALGIVCGQPIPETELFLAYWHTVLEGVVAASVPVVELSPLDTAPSQIVPAIYLDAVAKQKIASARLELPLLMLAGAFLIYVSLVVIGYLRALRAFGE